MNSASLLLLAWDPVGKLHPQIVSGDNGTVHAFGKSNTYKAVVALQRHFEFTPLTLQEML